MWGRGQDWNLGGYCLPKVTTKTSLVVQRLRLQAPSAGGPGLTPGGEMRFHTPQLKQKSLKKKSCSNGIILWSWL